MEKAVIYARYSSHSQGEQSIEGQLSAAHKYAEAKGYAVVHEYIDRAMTGRNDNREDFQRMLSDCAKHTFSVILVWKIDRFGRNREEIALNKYRAKKYGVHIEYVAENVPDSPEGVIVEALLEGMAEYYSLQLSQNIRRGYAASAAKCQCLGGPYPLGYVADPKTKKFVINEAEVPAVRMIFNAYANGQTCAEICKQLNEMGVKTTLKKDFNKNSLRKMLKNVIYIGTYKNKYVTIEDGCPAIIDKALFEEVQRRLKHNQSAGAHHKTKNDYILTGKLFCGKCGAQMVGEKGTNAKGLEYHYYGCVNRKRAHACDLKAVPQEWIENIVLEYIKEILFDDAIMEAILNAVWDFYQEDSKEDDEMKAIRHELENTEKALNNFSRAIEQGLPMVPTITTRITELTAAKEDLELSLARVAASRGPVLTKEMIQYFLYQFRNTDMTDRAAQKKLIDVFVNAIYIDDDDLTFTFNYGKARKRIPLSSLKNGRGVFGYRALSSTNGRAYELFAIKNVFALKTKRPGR